MGKFKLGPRQERWLRALESGRYKQCKTLLGKGHGKDRAHCCLGVANRIFRLGVSECASYLTYTGFDWDGWDKDKDAWKYLGLRDASGKLHWNYVWYEDNRKLECQSLTGLNDTVGMSFKEIAAYIRANPENVFTKSC